jgi:hypothetical protein
MKKIIIACSFCLAVMAGHAQVFQDASGETNLFLGSSPFGWIRVNTSSESVTLGYNRFRSDGYDFRNTKTSLLFGMDTKISVKDGTGSLFSNKKFQPGISLNANFGFTKFDSWDTGSQFSFYIRPGISYNQFIYVSDNNSAVKVDTVKKWLPQAMLNFSMFIPRKRTKKDRHGNPKTVERYWIGGISSGYKKSNNFSSLDDITVNSFQFGNAQTYAITTQQGKMGAYSGYDVLPVNVDLAYNPEIFGQTSVGFNTYMRTEIFKPKNTVNIGIGTYLTKDGQPRNIMGGLAWQFNDIGNVLDKKENLLQRSSVFAYIGFTIGAK